MLLGAGFYARLRLKVAELSHLLDEDASESTIDGHLFYKYWDVYSKLYDAGVSHLPTEWRLLLQHTLISCHSSSPHGATSTSARSTRII
jgi:hypothetical protein